MIKLTDITKRKNASIELLQAMIEIERKYNPKLYYYNNAIYCIRKELARGTLSAEYDKAVRSLRGARLWKLITKVAKALEETDITQIGEDRLTRDIIMQLA